MGFAIIARREIQLKVAIAALHLDLFTLHHVDVFLRCDWLPIPYISVDLMNAIANQRRLD